MTKWKVSLSGSTLLCLASSKGCITLTPHNQGTQILGMWTWSFSKLILKVLGQKLALLMALVEDSQSSELHALDVRYRVFKPEGVLFSSPTLIKKRVVELLPSSYF